MRGVSHSVALFIKRKTTICHCAKYNNQLLKTECDVEEDQSNTTGS